MDRLFDTVERSDIGLAKYSETNFKYVNRTGRPHFQRVRAILEAWFEEVIKFNPESAKDIWKRFRSNRDEQHLGALNELYLHHLLIENGFVPQAHPELQDVSKTPDFLALKDDEPQFYTEAVLAHNNRVQKRVDTFEAQISDAIDAVKSPDFFISVRVKSRDREAQPKLGSITKLLQQRIDELDYEKVCMEYERSGTLPKWPYTQGDWRFEFEVIPVKEERRRARTDDSRVFGMRFGAAAIVQVDTAIRDNVNEKCNKYGELNLPFIIVVSVIRDSWAANDETILEALLGKETYEATFQQDGTMSGTNGRDFNGIFVHPQRGAINQNLSGLLVVAGLESATIEQVKPILWHHPEANYPFDMNHLNVEQRYL